MLYNIALHRVNEYYSGATFRHLDRSDEKKSIDETERAVLGTNIRVVTSMADVAPKLESL